jgi:hypothetical protein
MEHDHIIAGLVRKRAELDGDVREAEKRIAALRADIDALDRTMRLFDPAQPAASVRSAVGIGGFTRPILDTLRQAETPLSARDIATKLAAARGQDVSTSAAMQAMTNRVRGALSRARAGLVSEKRGDTIFWRVE